MRYQESNYEELIDRADQLLQKYRYHEAWECIAAIPNDIKFIDYVEDCSFFAVVALSDGHLDDFVRFFKAYFNTISEPDDAFVDDFGSMFFSMSLIQDIKIYPYIIKVIKIVLSRFRTPNILTICAELYNIMNMYEEGLPLLNEALNKDPFFSLAWYNKVLTYHNIADFEKEIECCNYYIALVPETNDYNILTPLAISYANIQSHNEAITVLKKILTNKALLPKRIASVHSLLAESYNALSDYKSELIHRKKALNIFPEEVVYWSMLAQYYITSVNKPLKAENIMNEAMTRFPHNPIMHYMFAAVECQIAIEYNKRLKLESAASHIKIALRKIKDDLSFYLLASRIFFLRKDYTSALKYARHSYRINPNDNNAILYMVIGTFVCGKMTEFRRLYRIYEKLNPAAREDVLVITPEAEHVIDKFEEKQTSKPVK